jgi:hypothetical protein
VIQIRSTASQELLTPGARLSRGALASMAGVSGLNRTPGIAGFYELLGGLLGRRTTQIADRRGNGKTTFAGRLVHPSEIDPPVAPIVLELLLAPRGVMSI